MTRFGFADTVDESEYAPMHWHRAVHLPSFSFSISINKIIIEIWSFQRTISYTSTSLGPYPETISVFTVDDTTKRHYPNTLTDVDQRWNQ
jgi:hypothetical protein